MSEFYSRSSCCGAPVRTEGDENFVEGIDYGTHFFLCESCGRSCDVSSEDRFSAENDELKPFPYER